MTDERRWTIWPCDCGGVQREPGRVPANYACHSCGAKPIEVVPVSSVVPISRLREWIATQDGPTIWALKSFLDDVECASNPNNERTTDGDS